MVAQCSADESRRFGRFAEGNFMIWGVPLHRQLTDPIGSWFIPTGLNRFMTGTTSGRLNFAERRGGLTEND
jgi:hypothetical protein